MRESAIRIAVLLPDLLGTYGDRGNATVLARRLSWRGHHSEIVDVAADEPVPAGCDIYLLGGGEDVAQLTAVRTLDHGGFPVAVDAGAVVFAVCAGLQILGHHAVGHDGTHHPGLGLLDLTSRPGPRRAIGEITADADPGLRLADPMLTGFENHRGHTDLGPGATPLARVRAGTGNGDGTEGAVRGRILATYLHGPVLARNPALADHLLTLATGTELPPIEVPDLAALRHATLRVAERRSRWRGLGRRLTPAAWLTPGATRTDHE